LLNDLRAAFKEEQEAGIPLKDLDELERRQQRVKGVENYLEKIKERHADNLLTKDKRPYSQLNAQDKEKLALRYSRFMQASFPATPTERLHEIIGKLDIEHIPRILQAY
jgi:hypothetical protein